MSNIEFEDLRSIVLAARRSARQGHHVQRIQHMLAAAALASLAMIAVAGVLLGRLV
jgi:hypothetical protein